jgi:hypothetical protein
VVAADSPAAPDPMTSRSQSACLVRGSVGTQSMWHVMVRVALVIPLAGTRAGALREMQFLPLGGMYVALVRLAGAAS